MLSVRDSALNEKTANEQELATKATEKEQLCLKLENNVKELMDKLEAIQLEKTATAEECERIKKEKHQLVRFPLKFFFDNSYNGNRGRLLSKLTNPRIRILISKRRNFSFVVV